MERIEAFDILKGIGIILMIVAHTYGPNSMIWDFIYAFHMPLFFIVTGFFYKQKPTFQLIKTVLQILSFFRNKLPLSKLKIYHHGAKKAYPINNHAQRLQK